MYGIDIQKEWTVKDIMAVLKTLDPEMPVCVFNQPIFEFELLNIDDRDNIMWLNIL